jgi:phage tail-like protein
MDFGTITLYRRGEQPTPFRLRLGSMTIGSDPTSDIVINDPAVARFHARIICTPAGVQFSDLGSPGGTYINRARITAHAPLELQDGDRIQIGRIGLLFSTAQAESPAAEEAASAEQSAPDASAEPTEAQPATRPAPPERPAPPPQVLAADTPMRSIDEWAELFEAPIKPAPERQVRVLRGNRGPHRYARGDRELPYAAEDYLALLPPLYHDDPFLQRFLLIFKSILDPLERQIGQISHYFDPQLIPEQLLPWLAAWVDLTLDEKWPLERRRELVASASVLYRWRGTRRGLREYLRIYTGVLPRIVEPGEERRDLGETPLPAHTFRVVIEVAEPDALDHSLVERIIEVEKPAHTAYILDVRRGAFAN